MFFKKKKEKKGIHLSIIFVQNGFYNENTGNICTTDKLWHINIYIEHFMINLDKY